MSTTESLCEELDRLLGLMDEAEAASEGQKPAPDAAEATRDGSGTEGEGSDALRAAAQQDSGGEAAGGPSGCPTCQSAASGAEGETAPGAGEGQISATTGPADAIAAVLASPARTSEVRSLREAPEIEAFRKELVDGLIRADTVNQLLKVVNEVVTRLVR